MEWKCLGKAVIFWAMAMKKKMLLWIVAIVSLTSCSDNQIYFDKETQSINTCNGKTIRDLIIDEVNGNSLYRFVTVKDKIGANSFSLIALDKNYKLEKMGQELPLDSFNLNPDSEYRIRNSTNGDAAFGEINIRTNENAKIVEADITSCQ